MGKPEKQTKPKSKRYAKAMLALFAILSGAILVVLILLWQVLAQYESTTPRAAMDGYFSLLAAKDYPTIQRQADFTPTTLESWEEYYLFLEKSFGETLTGLAYQRVAGASPTGDVTSQRYAVYHEEDKLGELALYPDKNTAHHWRVSAVLAPQEAYVVTAPGHASVQAGGTLLSATGDGVTQEDLLGFEALPEGLQRPVLRHYPVKATLQIPEFTATGPGGIPCKVTTNNEAHTAFVSIALPTETTAEYTALIETAAQNYATFVTDDNTLGGLQAHLYPGTELATRMTEFFRGWYLPHEGYDFENIEVKNIVSTSADTFMGEITFDYLVYQQGVTHTFPTRYQMYFARYEDDWRLLDLQVR